MSLRTRRLLRKRLKKRLDLYVDCRDVRARVGEASKVLKDANRPASHNDSCVVNRVVSYTNILRARVVNELLHYTTYLYSNRRLNCILSPLPQEMF